MALIDYVDPDTATGWTKELLDADADHYGYPSLFARALANDPAVLAARSEYHTGLLEEGELDFRIGELVYLAVSMTNDCEYCVASHREVLVERVGIPTEAVDALATGVLDDFTDRERAAIEFARNVARDPAAVDERDIQTLSAAGFDDADVLRLLTIAAAAISANTIADALDIHPSDRDEPFAAEATTDS